VRQRANPYFVLTAPLRALAALFSLAPRAPARAAAAYSVSFARTDNAYSVELPAPELLLAPAPPSAAPPEPSATRNPYMVCTLSAGAPALSAFAPGAGAPGAPPFAADVLPRAPGPCFRRVVRCKASPPAGNPYLTAL
jgi:hypothetical protein